MEPAPGAGGPENAQPWRKGGIEGGHPSGSLDEPSEPGGLISGQIKMRGLAERMDSRIGTT